MGSLWAYYLSLAQEEVYLISRESPHKHLKIVLKSHPKLPAQSIKQRTARQLTTIDIVLVCVKSYQLEEALLSIKKALSPSSIVLLLQNGMGHDQKAQGLLPDSQILLASNTHGAYRLKENHLIHAGQGQLLLGPANKPNCLETLFSLIKRLQNALPEVFWRPHIYPILWKKLAINAVINPLTALNNCRNGELLTQRNIQNEIITLIEEMSPIIHSYCPELSYVDLYNEIITVASSTASNYSSMQQDVALKRTTEIMEINGFLIESAKKLGKSLPKHQQLVDAIRQSSH